jgi:hypothetical protein
MAARPVIRGTEQLVLLQFETVEIEVFLLVDQIRRSERLLESGIRTFADTSASTFSRTTDPSIIVPSRSCACTASPKFLLVDQIRRSERLLESLGFAFRLAIRVELGEAVSLSQRD